MATTGRKQVAPGQTIQSAQWGNVIWDQSVQAFTSAADRDTQYPSAARHAGAVWWLDDVKRLEVWDGAAVQPLSGLPYAQAYANSQSQANAAWQNVTGFTAGSGRVRGMTVTTNGIVATYAGIYLVAAGIYFTSGSSGSRRGGQLMINAAAPSVPSALITSTSNGNTAVGMTPQIFQLAAADVIGMQSYADTTGVSMARADLSAVCLALT